MILEGVTARFKPPANAVPIPDGLPVPDDAVLTSPLRGSFRAAAMLVRNDHVPEIRPPLIRSMRTWPKGSNGPVHGRDSGGFRDSRDKPSGGSP